MNDSKEYSRVYAVNFHAMIMQQKKKQYAKEKQGTLKRQEKKFIHSLPLIIIRV